MAEMICCPGCGATEGFRVEKMVQSVEDMFPKLEDDRVLWDGSDEMALCWYLISAVCLADGCEWKWEAKGTEQKWTDLNDVLTAMDPSAFLALRARFAS